MTNIAQLELSQGSLVASARSARKLLHGLDSDDRITQMDRLPSGFHPLDTFLSGGFLPQDMVILGGKPGTGKTVAMLQWARGIAISGHNAAVVSYDHGERSMLGRLLALELGEASDDVDSTTREHLRSKVKDHMAGACDAQELVDFHPAIKSAYDTLDSYADRLYLQRGSIMHTDLGELRAVAQQVVGPGGAMFVDFIQKVPTPEASEIAQGTMVANGLKDIAVEHEVAMIAAASVTEEGLRQRRLRVDHLNASSALVHEADLLLLINEKSTALSKVHLAYDLTLLESSRNKVVLTIEKNREGPASISFEFEKEFADFRFNPEGGFLSETLIDDTMFEQ
jgi:replicative DNA helicase